MTSAVVNFDWINHVFMRTNKNAGTGVILGLAFNGFDWFDQLEPTEGFEDCWVPQRTEVHGAVDDLRHQHLMCLLLS
jgi:hypothetical protein